MNRIRVLIIDDSALVRRILTRVLSSDPAIEVVGSAMNPLIARRKIKELNPDVVTLDVEMPKMDGMSFLRKLMRLRPLPVVMVSSLTEKGAEVTLEALSLGAIDFIGKPKVDVANDLINYSEEIIAKVKNAAQAKVRPRHLMAEDKPAPPEPGAGTGTDEIDVKYSATAVLQRPANVRKFNTTERIIAMGASTGGTEAIREILLQMPLDSPGILISQHIPPVFSTSFAERLNSLCQVTVSEATDGEPVMPGHAYLAPGNKHLLLVWDGTRYRCQLHDGPPVNRHKPSVDVLFRSVAESAATNAIGVILTGMGADGARGLKEMLESGATTIAQDEATSVVWGMPGEAVRLEAASLVLGLPAIAPHLIELGKLS